MKFNLGDKVRIRSNGVIGIIIARGYNEYLDENDKQQSFEEYQIEADKYYQCNEDELELVMDYEKCGTCNEFNNYMNYCDFLGVCMGADSRACEDFKPTIINEDCEKKLKNVKVINKGRVILGLNEEGNIIKERKCCGNCCEFDKSTGICEYNNIAVCRDSGICEEYYPEVQEINLEDNNDPVNHPSHYTDGSIEVMDYIEDKGFNFALGNAVKYISRAGKKDKNKTIQDLEKASWYLNREIERLKKLQSENK